MLEIKDILEKCKYRDYENGRDMYGARKIENLQIIKTPVKGKFQVSGEINETINKKYSTSIWIDEENSDSKIYGYHCECDKGTTLCSHCIALAFSFIKERKSEIMRNQVIQVSKDRSTSADILQVINKYALDTYLNKNNQLVNLELFLFGNNQQGFTIQGKIGTAKMVIIQNLVKLVQDIAARKKVSFSKSLEIYCARSSFNEKSQKRLEIIMEIVKAQFPNFEDVIIITSNYRSLCVNPFFIERIMEVYLDDTLSINGKEYKICQRDPQICLMIKNESDMGASLNMEEVNIINGNRFDFIMYEDSIYKCSEEFSKDVIPFIRTMNSMREKDTRKFYADRNFNYVSKQDYRAFCGNVLQRLGKHIGIVSEDIDFEEYMPTKAVLECYLDIIDIFDVIDENSFNNIDTMNIIDKSITLHVSAIYGSDKYDITGISDINREYRDIESEGQCLDIINKYFSLVEKSDKSNVFLITNEEKLFEFLEEGIEELNNIARVFAVENMNGFNVLPMPKVNVGIGLKGDLINIDISPEKINIEEMYEILNAYTYKKKYFRLKSGDFIKLEDGNLSMLNELREGLGYSKEDFISGKVVSDKYFAGYIDGVIRENVIDDSVRRNKEFKTLIRDLKDIGDTDFQVPQELNGQLRNYQKTGFRFLSVLSQFGLGGILADDMGLGKTIQVIAFLEATKKISLVICPSSLVYNWESEINKFAPDISVLLIIGDKENRKELLSNTEGYHVLITSYDLLKRDIDIYKDIKFEYVFADEAQYIKNISTVASKSIKRINASHRFALTGTPIENKLSDLYSIFQFIMPGYLSDYGDFKDRYESPIVNNNDEIVLKRFQKLVRPFILRRKKEEVLKDLPKKLENTVMVTMTNDQRDLYQAKLNSLKIELAQKTDKEFKEDRLKVLAELTRLRQICCNPEICYDNYTGGSGKMNMCVELIEEAIEGEHRILVFSQFVQMLQKIQEELNNINIESLMLSGKNTKEERKYMVDLFQRGNIPVFLISLKAGGTGLNLTAADMVIHFDPWWNKAVENQATDRAYRIGQIRTVTVMKLVTRNSIEEKIISLQEKKNKLSDSVIGTEELTNNVITKEELLEILEIEK